MPTAYIHIGMNKTGSTAVQHALAAARDEAAADGLVFPSAFGANQSMPLAAIFRADEPAFRRTLARRGFEGLVTEAPRLATAFDDIAAATARSGNDLIVSGEGLSHFPEAACAALKARLAPNFDAVRIIALVRPPFAFLRSVCQHRLRDGTPLDELLARPPLPQYRMRFEPYRRVFGADALRLTIHHPSQFVAGCVLQTVLAAVQRPLPHLAHLRAGRANESLSLPALKLLQAIGPKGEPKPLATLPPPLAHALEKAAHRALRPRGGFHLPGRSLFARRPGAVEWRAALAAAAATVPGPPFRLPREIAAAAAPALAEEAGFIDDLLGRPIAPFDDPPREDDLDFAAMRSWSDAEIAQIVSHLGAVATAE
ncbi:hypothetical protein [Acuticoccus yangtzensis]|uniref:hypothetical protein n=1 Tax=Acuticoccus yangtzensis TaxID=1443441 RepID=UPI0009499B07|nr:hypothetical protein [Acuticoccus yangtzensis]